MPDLGDYITRLICDASKYTSGAGAAVGANRELSGSCNSIIGALNRQQRALETAGRTTLDWINADQKASFEVKEHTRNLLEHVTALKQADAIRKSMQDGTYRSSTQLMATADRSRHDQRQAEYDQMAAGLGPTFTEDMARVRMSRAQGVNLPQLSDADIASDTQANRIRAASARDQQEREQQERSANDQRIRENNQRIRERRQAEADAERSSYTSVILPQMTQEEVDRDYRRRAARARQEQEDRDYAASQNQQRIRQAQVANMHRRQAENQGRQGGGWMLMEGGRAIEDFTQGSVYGGFKGGMLAASNNLSQMGMALQGMNMGTSRMAQALGTYGGLIGSAISTTVILGTVAIDAWMKNTRGAKEAKEAVDNYESSVAKAVSREMELRGIRQRGEDLSGVNEGSIKSQKKAIDDEQARLIAEAKERHIRDKNLGVDGRSADDIIAFRQRMKDRNAELVLAAQEQRAPVLPPLNAIDRQLLRARPEAMAEDAIRKRQEQEGKLGHELDAQKERIKSLAQEEAELARIRREAAEKEAEVGRKSDREIMMKARDEDRAFEQKKLQEKVAGAKWAQGRMEEVMLDGMKDPKSREYYQAQKEHAESLHRTERLVDLNVMAPFQKEALDLLSAEKRDRAMRMTKYGDLQADGASGFGSADIKSVQGTNNVMKAIRYAEQDKTIAELKKIGDILAEKQRAEADGITIKNLVPVETVNF